MVSAVLPPSGLCSDLDVATSCLRVSERRAILGELRGLSVLLVPGTFITVPQY